jgi:hypothetical protein
MTEGLVVYRLREVVETDGQGFVFGIGEQASFGVVDFALRATPMPWWSRRDS